ncbi:MAG: elongation factor G [Pirellulales bacterium]|nr:elongation factor G [Pirellulales bacterium]
MPRELSQLRNIGIIAHIDAGKTTVTERMLYYSGAIRRMGDVDKGTTETDFDVEEQQRGITIYAATVTFQWKDVTVNLIDTPGHVDFTAEVERSLRVLDGGVVVFSAREGVEAQSETVWRQADRYHVPRLAFINKMDREGADFYGTLEEIRTRLEARPLALQIPVGVGPPHQPNPFRGVIDLVERKMLTFEPESLGARVLEHPIPPEMVEDAELWRTQLLEQLYDYSNELVEKALAEEPVPPELIRRVIRDATLHHLAVPVLCGAALHYQGVQPLLDAVAWYLPSPADRPPVEGTEPQKADARKPAAAKRITRHPRNDEPFCGLVFKVQADKHGDLCFVRVYSGVLEAGTRVLNPGKDKKENVSQLWHVQASRREQIQRIEAGDIGAVIGLRHSVTGDTLCDPRHPILLEPIQFPQTVISMAIEPETSAERKKLAETLEMLKRQDPTFKAHEDEETGQTIISGMGELHLEVIKHRLLRDFNLNVRVREPRVRYRETVERAVEVHGECHQVLAGQTQFARVHVRLEPVPDAPTAVQIESEASEDFPPQFLKAVLEVLRDEAEGGGSLGYPLINVRFTVLGGEVREGESTEVAFRRAAADAFQKALASAGIVLLEPVMKLEITTPEEHLGDIVSDLQQRRASITETLVRGRHTVIRAMAPLANLFGYSSDIRSLSQGRASCSMELSHYGPAPQEVLQAFL